MKKRLRTLAVLIVAIATLGIGGVAILVAVDTNEIRDLLSAEVKKVSGRKLAIKGDLNLAISLSPIVIANDAMLANAWGPSTFMVSLQRLEVGLDLIQFLKGEIDFTNFQLVAPNILLEWRAVGLGNWQFGPANPSTPPSWAPGRSFPGSNRSISKSPASTSRMHPRARAWK